MLGGIFDANISKNYIFIDHIAFHCVKNKGNYKLTFLEIHTLICASYTTSGFNTAVKFCQRKATL